MSLSVTTSRPRAGASPLDRTEARERSVERRVGVIWGLLVFNALTFYPGASILHIPSIVGKPLQQGSVTAALLLALMLNRRVIVRPNVVLCLVSLLVLETIITSLQPQHLGTVYRTFRLAEYVMTLWLLTPWWGRRDLLLVRCHLKAYAVVLGSVLLGLVIHPGRALPEGRLTGIIWSVPATQVAHYAAVVTGLAVVLWLCHLLRGRVTLLIVTVTLMMMILSHTRTALVGLLAGLVVAGLSLIVANARVRKLFAVGSIVISVAVITLSGFIATWLARGETTAGLDQLSGRTRVWGPLLAFPRDKFQMFFGFGLSNKSFMGLPIDSSWLSSYNDEGLIGVTVCATVLLFLFVAAYFQPRGVQRALALFLVTYLLIASFTEDGFTDATTYLLEIALVGSLLVPYVVSRKPT
jgi:O-Antigen ligase